MPFVNFVAFIRAFEPVLIPFFYFYYVGGADIGAGAAADAGFRDLVKRRLYPPSDAPVGKTYGASPDNFCTYTGALAAEDAF